MLAYIYIEFQKKNGQASPVLGIIDKYIFRLIKMLYDSIYPHSQNPEFYQVL